LAAALRHNSSLQWLELNNNAIGDVGATALADAIAAGATQQQSGPGTAALRTLRLRHNAISDEGFMALANALMANPPLSELDVRLNTAHGAGASALVSSLSDNTHCSCLLLSGNMLTRDEAVKLQRVAAGRVRAAEQWLLDSEESTSVDSSTRSSGSIMWWADVPDVVLMATPLRWLSRCQATKERYQQSQGRPCSPPRRCPSCAPCHSGHSQW